MLQQLFAVDNNTIYFRAVRATHVAHHNFASSTYKFDMPAADVGVVENNVVFQMATNDVVAFM